jgi:phosphoribosylformylglycinamidine cyclo-ligase
VKFVGRKKKAYASAGVDVDLGNTLKRNIQRLVRRTHGAEVLGKIGGFGGLFRAQFRDMREPVLVTSIDGVGTKLKIAFAMNKHDTVGADLVNHCVNDIAALGARPLFFLDYIGCEKLEARVFDQLLHGFSRACRSAGCALIGGETAQMPGMYRKGEYDLAGCIVGVVDRPKIIDGRKIKPGDTILGLMSNGLHTNGYSLARKILFEKMRLKVSSRLPRSTLTVGEELLRVHKNYQPLLAKVPAGTIKGLAHITGGGLTDNLPRVLPKNCDAVIETKRWRVPGIFQILQRNGNVAEPGESRAAPLTRKRQSRQEGTGGAGQSGRLIQSAAPSGVERIDPEEMYQVFNMGIGMAAIVSERDTAKVMSMLKAKQIGRIERGSGKTQLL